MIKWDKLIRPFDADPLSSVPADSSSPCCSCQTHCACHSLRWTVAGITSRTARSTTERPSTHGTSASSSAGSDMAAPTTAPRTRRTGAHSIQLKSLSPSSELNAQSAFCNALQSFCGLSIPLINLHNNVFAIYHDTHADSGDNFAGGRMDMQPMLSTLRRRLRLSSKLIHRCASQGFHFVSLELHPLHAIGANFGGNQ